MNSRKNTTVHLGGLLSGRPERLSSTQDSPCQHLRTGGAASLESGGPWRQKQVVGVAVWQKWLLTDLRAGIWGWCGLEEPDQESWNLRKEHRRQWQKPGQDLAHFGRKVWGPES